MPGYGQFCPIAQAAEVLTERWTPLVIREFALGGSRRFNDIQRGVPLMSSSLLTKRLRDLERAGIVERRRRPGGSGSEYHLTPEVVRAAPDLRRRRTAREPAAGRGSDTLSVSPCRRRTDHSHLWATSTTIRNFPPASSSTNTRIGSRARTPSPMTVCPSKLPAQATCRKV
jgi:DNA-binding HxlR family transcriptional regulator